MGPGQVFAPVGVWELAEFFFFFFFFAPVGRLLGEFDFAAVDGAVEFEGAFVEVVEGDDWIPLYPALPPAMSVGVGGGAWEWIHGAGGLLLARADRASFAKRLSMLGA
jgi:hypothetical protein